MDENIASPEDQGKPAEDSSKTKVIEDQNNAIEDQSKTIEDQSKTIEEQSKTIEKQSKKIKDQSKTIEEQSKTIKDQGKAPENAITMPMDGSGDSTVSVSHDTVSGDTTSDPVTTHDGDHKDNPKISSTIDQLYETLNSDDFELKWEEDDDIIDEETPGLIKNLGIKDDEVQPVGVDEMDVDAIDTKIYDNSKPLDKKMTDTQIPEEVAENTDAVKEIFNKMDVDDSNVDEIGPDSVAQSSTENAESKIIESQQSVTEEIEILPEANCDKIYTKENIEIRDEEEVEQSTDAEEASETKVVSNDVENVLIADKTSESLNEPEIVVPEEVPKEVVAEPVNITEEPTQAIIELPGASIAEDSDSTYTLAMPSVEVKEKENKETLEVLSNDPVSKFTEDSDVIDFPNTEIALKQLTTNIPKDFDATDNNAAELPTAVDMKETVLDNRENTVPKDNTTEDEHVESIEDFIATMPVLNNSKIEKLMAEDDTNEPIENDKIPALSPTETDLDTDQGVCIKSEVEELSAEISLSNDATDINTAELPTAVDMKSSVLDNRENTLPKDNSTEDGHVESIDNFIATMPVLNNSKIEKLVAQDDTNEPIEDDKIPALLPTETDLDTDQGVCIKSEVEELSAEISLSNDATDINTAELPTAVDMKESVLGNRENTPPKDNTTEDGHVESIEDFIATMPVLNNSKIEKLVAEDDTNEPIEDDKIPVLSPTETDLGLDQEACIKSEIEELSTENSLSHDGTEENKEFSVKDELISTEEAMEMSDETGFLPVIEEVTTVMETQAEQLVTDDDDFVAMTDSLGLLSESTRVVEEDDQDEEDDVDGDDEEDADDDHDEQDDGDDESTQQPDHSEDSNQITAEHSEDSNAPVSESDTSKGQESHENTSDGFPIKDVHKCIPLKSDVIQAIHKPDGIDADGVKPGDDVVVSEESKDGGKSMEVVKDMVSQARKTPEKQIIATKDAKAISPDIINEAEIAIEEPLDADKEIEKEIESMDKELKDKIDGSILKELLSTSSLETDPKVTTTKEPQVEDKVDDKVEEKLASGQKKSLQISEQLGVVNIVDLEESSEDDLQEVHTAKSPARTTDDNDTTSVNIPAEIDIMSAGSGASSIVSGKGRVVVQGLPKPQAVKKTRLNTSEISIKTANTTAEPLVIPETKFEDLSLGQKDKPEEKHGLEIFSLDSDDDDSNDPTDFKENMPSPPVRRLSSRCVNPLCKNDNVVVRRFPADGMVQRYYEVKRRRVLVCEHCAEHVTTRAWQLMEGFKSPQPLLSLSISRPEAELVEVLDSDSDGEGEAGDSRARGKSPLGADRILELEEQLADIINKTWVDCNLSERLLDAKIQLEGELDYLEKGRQEVEAIFDDLQAANDLLRSELYACFAPPAKHLPALEIYDMPDRQYTGVVEEAEYQEQEIRRSKRPRPAAGDNSATQAPAAKRAAIPLGYKDYVESKEDDSTDIRVVKLSAEAAPASLPPAGSLTKPPLKAGDIVLARRETSGAWLRATVLEVLGKQGTGSNQFTNCRIRFEHKSKLVATLTARELAYWEAANVRLIIGTRVIALFIDTVNTNKRRMYYSGIIAEMPNPVNNYRYLIFFDIGYAQYVVHNDARVVCECAWLVWEEVQPLSREFVRQYLVNYPERPMVRLHAGQKLKTEWNGKWWVSKVLKVDASLVQVYFEADDRTEWIYRGSTRLAPLYLELQAAERARPRHSTANKRNQQNMPYVEYTRTDEPADVAQKTEEQIKLHNEELRRQRAVAKKSTATPLPPHAVTYPQPLDSVMSRVVYYTPKAAVKPHKMSPHTCSARCRRTDVLPLKELRTYNPLARPLLSGWERQLVRYKGRKEVMYRAPCGRRLRNMPELHRYLTATQSEMSVDLFDFNPMTHCLAEFLLNRCRVTKKDLSHGKENVPVPCVNYYDNSLPEMCLYNTERSPTAGVPLNLDNEFLCGCDCTDDCEDKSKCQCWQLTLEGARTIGMDEDDVGYVYKRLPDPVPTGIYECNSRCKCKQTCLNRVAQHPLQLKLQVFKTQNRGWGIRALNDVPKGAFLCVYAGNLLTDATANLDGLNEGDEYLAELDYIEVVEQMKEGFEDDVPARDKKLDKKEGSSDSEEDESSSSEEEEKRGKSDEADGDFKPDYIPRATTFNTKRLRKRDKKKKGEVTEEQAEDKSGSKREREDDGCITISDDEDVKEPSNFTAQAGMEDEDLSPKKKSVRSHFGKDEACYIMDAKVQGNIGRYLNHSCMPNVFVQNVFVDTHDLRFPWVAFFALSHVRAGTELTWNYNYDVGSVPGKVLKCYCGAPNCRGRLL